MLLCVLFCVALSLPFASCFETDKYLSEPLLASLPDNVKEPASKVKDMLNSNTWLHFDQKLQTWDLNNILFFREEYLPALLKFGAAAAKTFTFQRRNPFAKQPFPPLDATIGHLLDTKTPFRVEPASPELNFKLRVAEENFVAGARTWLKFVGSRALTQSRSPPEEWSVECGTLEPVASIALSASPICLLMHTLGKIGRSKDLELLQAMAGDADNLGELAQELKKSTNALPELFDALQRAVKDLKQLHSWLGLSTVNLWADALKGGPLDYSQLWSQEDGSGEQSTPAREEFIRVVNRFRASLLTQSVLLELTARTGIISIANTGSLPESILFERAQTWLELANSKVAPILENVSTITQSCQQADDFMGCMQQLSEPISKLAGKSYKDGELHNLVLRLYNRFPVNQFSQETLKALRDTYGFAKRILGAYVEPLELGIGRLGASEWDFFLLQFLKDPEAQRLLPELRFLMHRIELLELSDMERYNWTDFPLCRTPDIPDVDDREIEAARALGRRGIRAYEQEIGIEKPKPKKQKRE